MIVHAGDPQAVDDQLARLAELSLAERSELRRALGEDPIAFALIYWPMIVHTGDPQAVDDGSVG